MAKNIREEIKELIQQFQTNYQEGIDYESASGSEVAKLGVEHIRILSPRLRQYCRERFHFPPGVSDYLDYYKENQQEGAIFYRTSKTNEYEYFCEKNTQIKEKLLRNLDKICLDPLGELANAELLKSDQAIKNYDLSNLNDYKAWLKKVHSLEIEGEEIFLENSIPIGSYDYQVIKRAFNGEKGIKEWDQIEGLLKDDNRELKNLKIIFQKLNIKKITFESGKLTIEYNNNQVISVETNTNNQDFQALKKYCQEHNKKEIDRKKLGISSDNSTNSSPSNPNNNHSLVVGFALGAGAAFEEMFGVRVKKVHTSRQKPVLHKVRYLQKSPTRIYTKLRKKAFVKLMPELKIPIPYVILCAIILLLIGFLIAYVVINYFVKKQVRKMQEQMESLDKDQIRSTLSSLGQRPSEEQINRIINLTESAKKKREELKVQKPRKKKTK
ncbi:2661_t:CDS:2 [Funneliformis geosporum]|uniref:2661_t:CDS:1 n=1 Tax=Funneliformis geosporum TaxID=1117311 RepID=A0A9W4SDP5_9GLOM|nr:2661_t:CDS:2 [Funneliformis geosporum]